MKSDSTKRILITIIVILVLVVLVLAFFLIGRSFSQNSEINLGNCLQNPDSAQCREVLLSPQSEAECEVSLNKDSCYFLLANSRESISLCDKIISQNLKSRCYAANPTPLGGL